jgi:hypothetical protein
MSDGKKSFFIREPKCRVREVRLALVSVRFATARMDVLNGGDVLTSGFKEVFSRIVFNLSC